ncbi:MAG: DUF3322 domain-containing protein [Pseudomonadota bacterium]
MNAPLAWSTPGAIRVQLQRIWDDGRVLSARLGGEALFPFELRLRQPGVAELGEQFDAVRAWIKALEAGSKAAIGHGYDIVWREINHRQLGRNRIPDRIVVATAADAVRLLGRTIDVGRFDQLAALTLGAFPQLKDWLGRRSLAVLEHAAAWERIVAILQWFVAHPRPQLYLRQLDIAGVDSKFIEARKALLSELLDQVMPADAVDASAGGARQFEARYGLLGKPALIRFRILDPAHFIGGLSDLSVPVSQFAALDLDVEHVFITENEINGLAFPAVRSAIVIFGGGYGIDRLGQADWLRRRDIAYWGDIDTHGFAILDRLRASLPHARSVLMDADTLHAHRSLWGAEDKDKRYLGEASRLDTAERMLFDALRDDVFGERIRMEQERLGYTWVSDAIHGLR